MFLKFAKLVSNLLGRTRWTSALIVVLLVLATLGRATPLEPLPNFDVQALDGNTIHSGDWPLQGKWLVIYVEPRCQPCTSLLTRLSKQDYPKLPAWTIIIVGGGHTDGVAALQKRFPDLASAQWFADPSRNASAALKLQGAPATFGVQNRNIQWTMGGILPDAKHLQTALNTWCAQ
jgi:hypothetical protein